MEDINVRFRELRKACKKTQAEWGEILGLSPSGTSEIESGRRNVTEKHLIMLSNWHERKINIEWLRTGKGGSDNMFLHPEENDLVAQAAALLGEKDQLFETLVITYSKLVPKNKEVLLNFFKDFSDTLTKRNLTSENNSQTAAISDLNFDITLDPQDADTLSTAVREAEESYIKSRSSSAKKKGSSASNSTESENGKAINQ